MNSIWNKNLFLFKERFSSLSEMLEKQIQKVSSADENKIKALFSFWDVSPAKNGNPSASDKNAKLKLHSSYNPDREAENSILQSNAFSKSQIVFLGFGLGYHVISCAKKINGENLCEKLILIENDPMHFLAALYYLDWSEVFKVPQLVLAINCPLETLIPVLENPEHINTGASGVSDSYFFTLPAFTAHNPQYFNSVKTLIERNKTKNDINSATYTKFSRLWIRNSFKNTDYIGKCRTVLELKENLKDSLSNKPFVLVAAGPSLEKELPYLQSIKDKAVFVCVETSLRSLLHHHINPQFCVLTDPQYYAWNHIAGLKAPFTTLICPLSVYPAVFRFECREIVLCSDIFPVSGFYENKFGSFGNLGAGGSVASSAWNLCCLLGADAIYTAGLDLAYPSKETHIRGSKAEQNFHTLSTRLNSSDKMSATSMYSAVPEYGKNYEGKKVLTDSRMKMFAWWFEARIAEKNSSSEKIKVYSLSKESLQIPGIEYKAEIDFSENKRPVPLSTPSAEPEPDSQNQRPVPQNQMKFLNRASRDLSLSQARLEFSEEVHRLLNLVNLCVEKCIINGPELKKDLSPLEATINESPLKEIITLASPGPSYLEEHKTTPPELAVYEKLQKEVMKYKQC